MIKSMTAFASAEKTKDALSAAVEIRSYNSRFLDIALRLPHAYLYMEERIKGRVAERVARGRIEIRIEIRDDSDEVFTFEINTPKARAYHEALVQLKNEFDINAQLSVDFLVGAGGVVKPAEVDRDAETVWPVVKDCLEEAMGDLVAMREREGANMAQDIAGRLDTIQKHLDQIEIASGDLLSHYQERLKERIKALTKDTVQIDPERIAQEAAYLAERSDISEEIVRVGSHIKQFRMIMSSEDSCGRKLNFLLQELNREFNTIGSKTEKINISHMVVDIKSELEKMREQVQNVE
ncbi:YicC/YloC family endoribonuclease [Thermodesulfobacteriota bacterium]